MSAAVANVAAQNGAAKTKDADSPKLFVGQIPRAMTETELMALMEEFGPVFELVIMKDKVRNAFRFHILIS